MKVVVTGQLKDGRSAVLKTTELRTEDALVAPGLVLYELSGLDGTPEVPFLKVPVHAGGVSPSVGSIRVGMTAFPADGRLPGKAAIRDAELNDLLSAEGMHVTNTADFGWVISGEVGLELTDGTITWLQTGDTIVQGGVTHRWVTKPGQHALVGWIMVGADRRDST